MSDTSLGAFFERPILIHKLDWAIGASPLAAYNPWKLFLENPRVSNRICNFRNIRGTMNVKVTINGSSFHYGRMMLSYLPLAPVDIITVKNGVAIENAIEESQRPHIFIDPTHSQGGTLTLPFYWKENNLSIPDGDWNSMGELHFRTLQTLAHANGATDGCTISMYAWMTNVVLSGPTSVNASGITAQSAHILPTDPLVYINQSNEYETCPVSTPASTVAAIASGLSAMPVLGPFAKATQIAAGAVAGIAKLFGYSRPNNITAIEVYKPTYCGNLASSNAPDTCMTLAMDQKQELSVDTRTVGLNGADELAITNIASIESYLTQFPWTVATAAETLLWNCRVGPPLFDTVGSLGVPATEYHTTAMCYATHPFSFWRGTISYRFQIVASSFQKGRIRIVYDPYYKSGVEYNTNYTTVVDIAESRDFTIDVGWASNKTFLEIEHFTTATALPHSTVAFTTPEDLFFNGVLSVYVVNELTTPNTTVTNDIAINVFVSAKDDLQVAVPHSEAFRRLSPYAPQSSLELPMDPLVYVNQSAADPDHTPDQSAPETGAVANSVAATLPVDHSWDVYLGDPVASLRTLVKRYTHNNFLPSTPVTGFKTWFNVKPNYPFTRGYEPSGIHQTSLLVPYNFVNFTMFDYVKFGFAGIKGAIRWKYVAAMPPGKGGRMYLQNRPSVNLSFLNYSSAAGVAGSSYSSQALDHSANNIFTSGGCALTVIENNPTLEVELPFYSDERFLMTRSSYSTDTSRYYHSLHFETQDITATEVAGVQCYCAAGEDFMPSFYIGPPVWYYFPNPAPA